MNALNRAIIGLAAATTVAGLMGGCVDQEPSMSLRGSVVFEGEIVEIVDENDEVIDGKLVCDYGSEEAGSVDTVSSRAKVDLTTIQSAGNIFDGGYVFWADIENLLQQSTEVGSGGGSDNFEGLQTDQNYIMITGATIEFPRELNGFTGGQFTQQLSEKIGTERAFSSVIDSSGGGVLVSVPIIETDPTKVRAFGTYYDNVIRANGGDPEAVLDRPVPLVAEIQIHGETFSGDEVESNKYQFPMRICRNCASRPNFTTTTYCVADN